MLAGFEHFRELPIADKLRLLGEMWDDIDASSEKFPIPDWIQEDVRKRVDELNNNPTATISEEELWRQVDERRG